MGKNKRQKGLKNNKPSGKSAKPKGINKPQPRNQKSKSTPHIQHQHLEPTIPFSPGNRILLVGEGDFSFARSLVEHHECRDVTATVFEREEELREKYPQVEANIRALEDRDVKLRYGVDATRYGSLWKEVKGKMDRVVFNFPHVGGKTKDVNRQVRYNQELLVAFFQNALTSLSPSTPTSTSSIIITLFEGEPYTLWNIRDLARHSGLQVARSFKFQAKAYPGYKHARTLGVVKSKHGEDGGGWKGEERSSRSYVFVRKGDVTAPANGSDGKSKKDESSDDDDEDWRGDATVAFNGGGNNDESETWDGLQESNQSDQGEEVEDD